MTRIHLYIGNNCFYDFFGIINYKSDVNSMIKVTINVTLKVIISNKLYFY